MKSRSVAMSAIRYLLEQAANLLNSHKILISRFHAAGTKKSQQQDHQKIVQKIEGIYLKFLNVFDPLGSRYCRKLPEIDAKLARLAAKAAM